MTPIKKSTLFTLTLVALSSCSDSYLFGGGGNVPPPGNPGLTPMPAPGGYLPNAGQGNYPGFPGTSIPNGSGQGTYGAPNASASASFPQQTMTLTLDPDPALRSDEVIPLLFTDQAVDPFQVANSSGAISAELKLSSAKNIDADSANVEMHFIVTMRNGASSTLTRELVAKSAVIRRVGSQDTLEASLAAADQRPGDFKLTAQRAAANDEAGMRANAWNGILSVVRNGQALRLGRFTGPSN
ncbi:MAG: hypothetical protein JST16_15150 [Bdellovibrionales bacterium]|nr:hypothetical protein [Bdellovibrionales bacterium]